MTGTQLSEIVVPLDGRDASTRAVPVAGRIGKRLGLGVRLFAVSSDSDRENWMRQVAARHLSGLDVAIEVISAGDPTSAIVEAAGSNAMVCMATAASLLPHQGHVGSVAEGVTRQLGRPVILVGPEMEPTPGASTSRLIIPVDGSSLSEAALPAGGELASVLGVPAWIVTVMPPLTDSSAHMGTGAITIGVGYLRHLAHKLSESHGIDAEYEVLHHHETSKAIVDYAGLDGTVVMTTHGRAGLSRLFGGSVATGVVAHSRRAVVVLRPSDID